MCASAREARAELGFWAWLVDIAAVLILIANIADNEAAPALVKTEETRSKS